MKKTILLILFLISITGFCQTDVFATARSGTLSDIELIFKNNPELIDSKNKNGFTPLILACYKGNEEVSKFLIENTKTINETSDMGTALMAAAVKGNVVISEFLLRNGANPNLTDTRGTTALMYAVEFKNIELVTLLLKYKADKTIKNKDGKTAFEFAVFSNNQDIINLLKTN